MDVAAEVSLETAAAAAAAAVVVVADKDVVTVGAVTEEFNAVE